MVSVRVSIREAVPNLARKPMNWNNYEKNIRRHFGDCVRDFGL